MLKKDEPKGYVIYEGPSLLDGKPIVSILMVNSTNRKTGTKKKNMMQETRLSACQDPHTRKTNIFKFKINSIKIDSKFDILN